MNFVPVEFRRMGGVEDMFSWVTDGFRAGVPYIGRADANSTTQTHVTLPHQKRAP
jgi:hypothetical protein